MAGLGQLDGSLAGKRVIVTAAATGIGRAIARGFAAAGARVHVCDISEEPLAEFAGAHPGIGTTVADVARPEDVDRLFADSKRNLGGLDVLVNNAGIAGPTAPIEKIEPGDWSRTIAVNLDGAYLCTRKAVPLIRAAGGGSIVFLSSAAGRLGFPLRTPYAAAKWALIGLTQSLAIELGPDRIRVNAILPGPVEGDRMRRVIEAKAAATGQSFDEVARQELALVSLGRMIPPEHIANMILFICSDAGINVSGQSLGVDGNTVSLQ